MKIVKALDEYKSEVGAFANQRLLGNKAFMKKLITTEPSTAEKLIGKLREIRENLKVRKDPDAKAQLDFVRKAEKLFMQGLSEAGGTIDSRGKIHLANREEDKEKSPAEDGVRRLRSDNTEPAVLSNDSIDTLRAAFDGDITKEEARQVISMVLEKQAVFGDRRAVSDFVAKEPSLARNLVECIRTYLQTLEKNGQSAFEEDEMLRRTEGLLRTALEKNSVQSERGNIDESDEMRYNEYAEEQYESFGWVRANDVLTSGEWKDFTSKFADAVSGNIHAPKTKGGEYMIEVSDKGDSQKEGINNKIVYAKGKIESPQVSRILKIDLDNETDLDRKRREIYDFERRGIQQKAGGIRRFYYASDYGSRHDGQRASRSSIGDSGRFGADRGTGGSGTAETERGQVKFNRDGAKAKLTVNGETLNSIGKPTYRSDAAQRRRAVWRFGANRYYVEDASPDTALFYDTVEAAIEAENESLIRKYAKQYGLSENTVKSRLRDDEWFLFDAMMDGGVRRSRAVTGETVTISKGEMAKLHANYAGDKVFIKKDVAAAIKSIDALQKLPAAMRNELVTKLWKGYNVRLNEQGFAMFTEIMWHQIHAEILQESGFEMSEDEIAHMDEQIVNALNTIVQSGKPSIKARLESATSTEGYRKQAQFWRDEHSKAVQRNKQLNSLKFEVEKLANQKKGLYVNAANYRGDKEEAARRKLRRAASCKRKPPV